jgi:hypothetical protein
LYADGGHIPLPPLSFALTAFLFRGQGTWFDESLLNFVFQSLTILTMYIGLSQSLPRPIPLLTALATMPVFFALDKTLAYDAMTQALVALMATLAATWGRPFPPSGSPLNVQRARTPTRTRARIAILATATALCILCKQSTAVGAALGVCLALLFFPRSDPFPWRCWRVAQYAFATSIAFAAGCFLLSPYMDIRGFVTDVFIIGSEPKGGSWQLQQNLRTYTREIAGLCTPTRLLVLLVLVTLGFWGAASADDGADVRVDANGPVLAWPTYAAALVGIAAGLCPLFGMTRSPQLWFGFIGSSPFVGMFPADLLSTGLLLCLLAIACRLIGPLLPSALRAGDIERVAAFGFVTFPAAIFHSLSVHYFRWTYDNNPLVTVAIAGLCAVALRILVRLVRRRPFAGTALACVGAFALQFVLWSTFGNSIDRLRLCTVSWPEVSYLRQARLTERAAGMRQVVRMVRTLTPAGDQVLLLPEDPNVQAWFARPRPTFSSAILFVDQYWDRYVDSDFERLVSHPPKVIVMGPRHWSAFYQNAWHPNTGASRFIARVDAELLPRLYRLYAQQKVKVWARSDDVVDVFVRIDRSR